MDAAQDVDEAGLRVEAVHLGGFYDGHGPDQRFGSGIGPGEEPVAATAILPRKFYVRIPLTMGRITSGFERLPATLTGCRERLHCCDFCEEMSSTPGGQPRRCQSDTGEHGGDAGHSDQAPGRIQADGSENDGRARVSHRHAADRPDSDPVQNEVCLAAQIRHHPVDERRNRYSKILVIIRGEHMLEMLQSGRVLGQEAYVGRKQLLLDTHGAAGQRLGNANGGLLGIIGAGMRHDQPAAASERYLRAS